MHRGHSDGEAQRWRRMLSPCSWWQERTGGLRLQTQRARNARRCRRGEGPARSARFREGLPAGARGERPTLVASCGRCGRPRVAVWAPGLSLLFAAGRRRKCGGDVCRARWEVWELCGVRSCDLPTLACRGDLYCHGRGELYSRNRKWCASRMGMVVLVAVYWECMGTTCLRQSNRSFTELNARRESQNGTRVACTAFIQFFKTRTCPSKHFLPTAWNRQMSRRAQISLYSFYGTQRNSFALLTRISMIIA